MDKQILQIGQGDLPSLYLVLIVSSVEHGGHVLPRTFPMEGNVSSNAVVAWPCCPISLMQQDNCSLPTDIPDLDIYLR